MKVKYVGLCLCVLAFGSMAALCGCSAPAGTATENVVEYSISYEMDGGVNNTKNPAKYTAADLPIAIKSPIKQGFVFEGWTSAALGIGSQTRNVTIPVGTESDITLTAVWRDDRQNSTEAPTVPVEAPKVYDFAEFNGDSFPCGTWTANQLIGKYGEPKELRILYVKKYPFAQVFIEFENIETISGLVDPAIFSFYSDGAEGGSYSMTEKDMEVGLEVLSLTIYDRSVKLPRNLKIGQSTKEQVITAYPESLPDMHSSEKFGDSFLYMYAFFEAEGKILEGTDVGYVLYYFDENEILTHVEINWWFSDIK